MDDTASARKLKRVSEGRNGKTLMIRLDAPLRTSSLTISANPVGLGATSQALIQTGQQSSLLTYIAMMASVSLCGRMKRWLLFSNSSPLFGQNKTIVPVETEYLGKG
jgi:hypothetical protein